MSKNDGRRVVRTSSRKAERAYGRFARRFRLTLRDRVAYLASGAPIRPGLLLAGTALATSLFVYQTSPAQAQFTVTTGPNDVTNAVATATTDSANVNAATNPSFDRSQIFDPATLVPPLTAGPVTATIGGAVTGFGLAITNAQTGTNGSVSVTNTAGVTLDDGNVVTVTAANGTAAFNVNAAGGTINYTGNGNVSAGTVNNTGGLVLTNTAGGINLGTGTGNTTVTGNFTGAPALSLVSTGAQAVDLATGVITATNGGNGASFNTTSGAGGVTATLTGNTVTATGALGGTGILVQTGGGAVSLISSATIGGGTGFATGIGASIANTAGTNTLAITQNANVTASGVGINATSNAIGAAGAGGAISVGGSGSITGGSATGNAGIIASSTSTGASNGVLVNPTGTVTGAAGIVATSTGTATTSTVTVTVTNNVTANAATTNGSDGFGVSTSAVNGLNTVNQTGGTIQATRNGIDAVSTGTGGVQVTATGGQIGTDAVTRVGGIGINAVSNSAATPADVNVRAGNNIFSTGTGVNAFLGLAGSSGSVIVDGLAAATVGVRTIDATGIGISATNAGTGAVTVGRTGFGIRSITSGANGIVAQQTNTTAATTGAVSILTAGDAVTPQTISVGAVAAPTGSSGIVALAAGPADGSGLGGAVSVTNNAAIQHNAGATAGGVGIDAGTARGGGVTVTNNSTGTIGAANTAFAIGIRAASTGTAGGVSVNNAAAIGTAGVPVTGTGILATITDPTGTPVNAGSVMVNGAGAIFSGNAGIVATTNGLGAVSVGTTTPIGNITAGTAPTVPAAGADGIVAAISNANSTASVAVRLGGALTASRNGILAGTAGTGPVTVTTDLGSSVGLSTTGTTGNANGIVAAATNTGTTGLVTVTNNGTIAFNGAQPFAQSPFTDALSAVNARGNGILAANNGTGGILVNANNSITGTAAAANSRAGIQTRSQGATGDTTINVNQNNIGPLNVSTSNGTGAGAGVDLTVAAGGGNLLVRNVTINGDLVLRTANGNAEINNVALNGGILDDVAGETAYVGPFVRGAAAATTGGFGVLSSSQGGSISLIGDPSSARANNVLSGGLTAGAVATPACGVIEKERAGDARLRVTGGTVDGTVGGLNGVCATSTGGGNAAVTIQDSTITGGANQAGVLIRRPGAGTNTVNGTVTVNGSVAGTQTVIQGGRAGIDIGFTPGGAGNFINGTASVTVSEAGVSAGFPTIIRDTGLAATAQGAILAVGATGATVTVDTGLPGATPSNIAISTGGTNGIGILARTTGANAGSSSILLSGLNTTVTATGTGADGLRAENTNTDNTGAVSVTNNATPTVAGTPTVNAGRNAIMAGHQGTGPAAGDAITVSTGQGSVTGTADTAVASNANGIFASNTKTTSAGNITITNNGVVGANGIRSYTETPYTDAFGALAGALGGPLSTRGIGIAASQNGTGTVTVNANANVTAGDGTVASANASAGIQTLATSGQTTINVNRPVSVNSPVTVSASNGAAGAAGAGASLRSTNGNLLVQDITINGDLLLQTTATGPNAARVLNTQLNGRLIDNTAESNINGVTFGTPTSTSGGFGVRAVSIGTGGLTLQGNSADRSTSIVSGGLVGGGVACGVMEKRTAGDNSTTLTGVSLNGAGTGLNGFCATSDGPTPNTVTVNVRDSRVIGDTARAGVLIQDTGGATQNAIVNVDGTVANTSIANQTIISGGRAGIDIGFLNAITGTATVNVTEPGTTALPTIIRSTDVAATAPGNGGILAVGPNGASVTINAANVQVSTVAPGSFGVLARVPAGGTNAAASAAVSVTGADTSVRAVSADGGGAALTAFDAIRAEITAGAANTGTVSVTNNTTGTGNVTGDRNGIFAGTQSTGPAAGTNAVAVTTGVGSTTAGTANGIFASVANTGNLANITVTANGTVNNTGTVANTDLPYTAPFGAVPDSLGGTGGAGIPATGNGIAASSIGTGNILVTGSGNVTGVNRGIVALQGGTGTTGSIVVSGSGSTTATGTNAVGINAIINNTANTVNLMVDRTGDVTATGGTGATASTGIDARTNGTGSVMIGTVSPIGNVTASGVAINGLQIAAGTGGVAVVTGTGKVIASGDGFNAINAVKSAGTGAGLVGIDNAATVQHFAGSGGIALNATTTGTGGVTVNNTGAVAGTAGTGAFATGINAVTTGGSGNVLVTTSGAGTIGAGRAVTQDGIDAAVNNTASAAEVRVLATAAIEAGRTGIDARTNGSGNIVVGTAAAPTGNIIAGTVTVADGIHAEVTNNVGANAVGVVLGGALTSTQNGIFAGSLAFGAGSTTSVTTNSGSSIGPVSGGNNANGIFASNLNNATTGAVSVLANGSVTANGGNPYTNGTYTAVLAGVGAALGGPLPTTGIGIAATNLGSGGVLVDGGGAVSGSNRGIVGLSNGSAITITGGGTTTATAATGVGINAVNVNTAASGAVLVNRTGTVTAGGTGIDARTAGLGSVTVGTAAAPTGTITAGTGSVASGIRAEITNGSSAAAVSVTTAGAITASQNGVFAATQGTGIVGVTAGGTIGPNGGGANSNGVFAANSNTGATGLISVTANAAITANGGNAFALAPYTTAFAAAGLPTTGNGIAASNAGSGGVTVNANANVTATGAASNAGIQTLSAGAGTTNVNVAANTRVSGTNGTGTGAALSLATGGAANVSNLTIQGGVDTSGVAGAVAFNNVGINAAAGTTGGFGVRSISTGAGTLNVTGADRATSVIAGNAGGAGACGYQTTSGGSVNVAFTNSSIAGPNGICATTTGVGTSSTVTVTNSTVTGTNGDGVISLVTNAAGGANTVTSNSSTVSGTRNGIFAGSQGTGAVSVTTSGSVTGGGNGIFASQTNAANPSALTITANGPVTSNGTTAFTSVPYTAAFTAAGLPTTGLGIGASSAGSGALNVTANAAVTGVNAGIQTLKTGGGATTVDLAANQTATATGNGGTALAVFGTSGPTTVFVRSGATAQGTTGVRIGTGSGNATLNNAGTIQGPGGTGVTTSATTGTVTFDNVGLVQGGTPAGTGRAIFNAGGALVANNAGTMNGFVDSAAGSTSTFNNSGIWNFRNTATLSGNDTINNTGAFNVVANGALNGLETFNNQPSGRLTLAGGDLAGSIATFNNTGGNGGSGGVFLEGRSLSGIGVFNNNGYLQSVPQSGAAPTNAFVGAATFNNQANGVISLVNNQPIDTLTLGGNYNGTAGSQIRIDVNLQQNTRQADRVIINGQNNGQTTLVLNRLDNPNTTLFSSTPIPVVVSGGGAGQVTLSQGIQGNGFVTFELENNAPGSFQIVSRLNTGAAAGAAGSISALLTSLNVGFFQSVSAFIGAPNPATDDRTTTASVSTNNMSWAQLNSTAAAAPSVGPANGITPNTISGGLWARGVAGDFTVRGNSTAIFAGGTATTASGTRVDNNFAGMQVGIDTGVFNIDNTGWNLHMGVTGGEVFANGTQRIGATTSGTFNVPFIGVYSALTNGPFFSDLSYRHDFYDARLSNALAGANNQRIAIASNAVSGSAGYRFDFENLLGSELPYFVEPSGSMSYTNTSIGSFRVTGGVLQFRDIESILGRFGLRFGTAFQLTDQLAVQPFVTGSIWHEFAGNSVSRFVADNIQVDPNAFVPIITDRVGTFGQVGVGVSAQLLDTPLIGYIRSDFRFGDKLEGYAVNGGVRYQF